MSDRPKPITARFERSREFAILDEPKNGEFFESIVVEVKTTDKMVSFIMMFE